MKLLVINPNTTIAITALLHRHVGAAVRRDVGVHVVTARFGAPYIADEASFAAGADAVLDAWQAFRAEHAEPDAVLVGCFGDPGCAALRGIAAAPVIGLAGAAMEEAASRGRFAIVTGGAAWRPMLARLAAELGFDDALAAIHIVAPSGAELAADPEGAMTLLSDACRRAAVGVDSVVLGGAGLADFAEMLAPCIDVPLIDSIGAGARAAMAAASARNAR